MKRGKGGDWHAGVFSYKVEIESAALIAGAEAAQKDTLQELGGYILGESTAIAPLRAGTLIASSYMKPSADRVEIGYNEVYAHRQHDETGFYHPNGREAKYLSKIMEDPNTLSQAQSLFADNLNKRIGR